MGRIVFPTRINPAILECRHRVNLQPEPTLGDVVLCSRCDQYRKVTGVDRSTTVTKS